MNTLSGYVEVTIAGEVLPFKFGTNAWALFCEMHKIELFQIAESGILGKVDEQGNISSPDLSKLRDIFYCGYQSACRSQRKEVKYNLFEFGDMLDESFDAVKELQKAMLTAKVMGFSLIQETGNPPAPGI